MATEKLKINYKTQK